MSNLLITGATGQVGFGVAAAAVARGDRVLALVRSAESAARTADLLPVETIVADPSVSGSSSVITQAIEQFGGVDTVVAPMGAWWQGGASLRQDTAELVELLGAHVVAQHRLIAAAAPYLSNSAGKYVMITGAVGESYSRDSGLLVAAVRAQYALSDVLRHELSDEPWSLHEVRIATRVERVARPGVVTSLQFGEALLAKLDDSSSPLGSLARFPWAQG